MLLKISFENMTHACVEAGTAEDVATLFKPREKGTKAFLNQNNGHSWMLPEMLRLADHGLKHDECAPIISERKGQGNLF
jgi:hypothetical protein